MSSNSCRAELRDNYMHTIKNKKNKYNLVNPANKLAVQHAQETDYFLKSGGIQTVSLIDIYIDIVKLN